jgi:ATP-dependent Lon protease
MSNADVKVLIDRVNEVKIPEKLHENLLTRLDQLDKLYGSPSFMMEYDRTVKYIDWIIKVPWDRSTADNLDLVNAQRVLESHHYGLGEIKDRVLEYLAVTKLKKEKGEEGDVARAPILFFVGLVGTGKTTIAISIAEAMGRKFARIPFGGMGDPLDLRGMSRMHAEAEPGKVIKALVDCGSSNPVILLDEIDRVTDTGLSSIMGVLVELLDPKQNYAFTDHYLDYPVDLSHVLFIATANNTNKIATAVMDRLEPLQMPSYSDAEKIVIGQRYVLPAKIKMAGLPDGSLSIAEDAWAQMVRPLGFDAGIRTLERTIDGVVRKVARLIIEGKLKQVVITPQNAKEYLPQ